MTRKPVKIILISLASLGAMYGIFALSRFNYLFFLFSVEIASIIIGISLFVIVINTLSLTNNAFLLLLGSTFLTASVIDLVYIITYKGMNIFPGISGNIPFQLWISARFIQALGLLIAPFILDKVAKKRYFTLLAIVFPLVLAVLFPAIFAFRIFPACFIDGHGFTLFYKYSGYIITAIFLVSAVVFIIRKKLLEGNFYFMLYSLIFAVLSSISMSIYQDTLGILNVLEHVFKIISFVFLYMVFTGISLKDPFSYLFKNLREAKDKLSVLAATDILTGISNQTTVYNELKKQYDIARRFDKNFSIIMIDIDNLRNVNEAFGHPAGDEAIKCFTAVIRKSVRDVDIKGRYGGDEFVISPIEADMRSAFLITQKIQENLGAADPTGGKYGPFKITISAGVSGFTGSKTLDTIISDADKALFESKRKGRNRVTILS